MSISRPAMTFEHYKYLVFSDLYRITGRANWRTVMRCVLLGAETYQYNFWLRSVHCFSQMRAARYFLYPIAKLMHRRLTYKFGISIPHETAVGAGLYIGHFGGIVVNRRAIIGRNCNISQGVTLGQANRGRNKGCPIVGDNVYIGPGAKIVGAVTIGNNVAIGANCVVTRDVPDNSVVVGVPGRVISQDGAADYVHNTDYDRVLVVALPKGMPPAAAAVALDHRSETQADCVARHQ